MGALRWAQLGARATLLGMLVAVAAAAGEFNEKPRVASSLPTPECPVVESAEQAKTLCTGTFRLWGQRDGATVLASGATQSGPYQCSSCGIGYICPASDCPDTVLAYSNETFITSSALPACPNLDGKNFSVFQEPASPSCAELQQLCIDADAGWLMYARIYSHQSRYGSFACAGCEATAAFEGVADENEVPFDKPQMIALYIISLLFFMVSAVVDYQVFKYGSIESRKVPGNTVGTHSTSAWRLRYILYLLGYIDETGHSKYMCCNSCACNKSCRSKLSKLWDVLSVTIMSFGVNCLFQPSHVGLYACYFDGLVDTDQGDTTATTRFGPAFLSQFGKDDAAAGYELNPDFFSFFGPDFFLSELSILLFQLSANIMRQALSDAGYVSEIVTRVLTLAFAITFCVVSIILDWTVQDLGWLFQTWLLGLFILVLFIGPIASLVTWIIGRIIAAIYDYKPDPAAPVFVILPVALPVDSESGETSHEFIQAKSEVGSALATESVHVKIDEPVSGKQKAADSPGSDIDDDDDDVEDSADQDDATQASADSDAENTFDASTRRQ